MWFCNQRAGAESRIKEADKDAALAAYPAARRAMNGNHFQMGVLAYNLSSYFRVARLTPGP